MDQVERARDLARQLLAAPLPRRWAHSLGVGRKAESVAHLVGDDASVLISSALLHDVGYAPDLVVTGMHQLDGARYLRDVAGADDVVCRLVAHHSCAQFEGRNRGLFEQLTGEFAPVGGLLADAVTYADMTTTPDGEPVAVEQRLAEILVRYGDGDLISKSIREASPLIIEAVQRITARLAEERT
ncbi:HD domain-containing protein [Paractinoplanes hotanensis]|uniref:HD domain-containing protein n=1 Tax=Paractinoplanes hotanensis TaxID=2906497 RepID=A0ABT0YGI0_9ACTN|nr:HD domain-containing protein [Actinoplanes hotanensis]MCM4085151.1 HD domain-containing protein [Actinoplanes hotanensis]